MKKKVRSAKSKKAPVFGADYFGSQDVDVVVFPAQSFGRDQSLMGFSTDPQYLFRAGLFLVDYYKHACRETLASVSDKVQEWKNVLSPEEAGYSAIIVLNLLYPFCRRMAQDFAPEESGNLAIMDSVEFNADYFLTTVIDRSVIFKIIQMLDENSAQKFLDAKSIPVVVFDKEVVEVFSA